MNPKKELVWGLWVATRSKGFFCSSTVKTMHVVPIVILNWLISYTDTSRFSCAAPLSPFSVKARMGKEFSLLDRSCCFIIIAKLLTRQMAPLRSPSLC